MKTADIIRYYSREDVRKRIMEVVDNREIVIRYRDKVGKRPNTLRDEKEILKYVKDGATSFHASIERWKDPMKIPNDVKEINEMRTGWDILLDVDSNNIEYSKIAADLIIQTIKMHGIKNFSVKFSGRGGFHIGIRYESFPKVIGKVEVRKYFPYGLKVIAEYISSIIEKPLKKKINKITEREVKDLSSFVSIDTIAISERHTFRMPYVFNEKSWLVSIPIEKVKDFEFEMAKPENVKTDLGFLDSFKEGEARRLFILAFDFKRREEKKIVKEIESENYGKINKIHFPPCIKNILKGLEDGRKRSLFILMNFLKIMKWSYKEIEQEVIEWNKRNKPPLKESYIKTQLNWFKSKGQTYTTPSCDNSIYYKDIGVCVPDDICKKIKNPIVYPFWRMGKKFGRNNLGRNKKTSDG